MPLRLAVLLLLLGGPSVTSTLAADDLDGNWPQFRGPSSRGIADGHATRTEWDVDADDGILFRVDLPGLSHASPVIWGDLLFVTCAERDGEPELKIGLYGSGDSVEDEGEHVFSVFCLDKNSGEILWDKVAFEGVPEVKRHPKATHNNSSPAVGSEHVVAFFGSEGLYCYDHEGVLLWEKDFGVLDCGAPGQRKYQWGFASSPVIHGDHVIVQCDVQDQSFLAVLRLEDGEELWRTDRDEDPTWGTPNVDVRQGRAQVLCNGYKHIGGYDLHTGKELWRMAGGGDVPVPTLTVADDLIYVTSAHGRMAPICAIDVMAEGEIEMKEDDPRMKWFYPRRGIYMQTPVIYRGQAYFCNDAGILGCMDAKTGETHYRERLGEGNSGFSASGVAADGKLYFPSEEGAVHVIAAGPQFEKLASNPLGDICMASPAISEGVLYFRTRSHVVAIAAGDG